VRQVLVAGATKSSVKLLLAAGRGRWASADDEGAEATGPTIQADLRVIDESCWGAALMYFTGSKEHNVKMRERALKMGLTLNEYGLFPEDGNEIPPQKRGLKPVAARTEEDVYATLGMAWVPPEMREDRGEMEAFALGSIAAPSGPKKAGSSKSARAVTAPAPPTSRPVPIVITDIKCELHAHTTASDGSMSILELATEAKRRGFHTIAVTDHSKSSVIANGLSPERLRQHILAIRAARKQIDGITILAGSEVDILADGRLDYDDDLLAELDIVIASPHAGLRQEGRQATDKMLKVIRHPLVHIIGHPTGRMINKRPGMPLEINEIVAAAKEHNVALEINAHWNRLDLRDAHIRAAVDAGCLLAIDCDTHEVGDMNNLRYGIATARRGWLTAEKCINTWPAAELHGWLKAKRG